MSQNGQTMLAVMLIVGLVVGAGVGYFMAPGGETDQGSSAFKLGYDDGFEDGYTEGQRMTSTVGSQENLDRLDDIVTLVYGAIGASLIAALASIVALMQINRKIVG